MVLKTVSILIKINFTYLKIIFVLAYTVPFSIHTLYSPRERNYGREIKLRVLSPEYSPPPETRFTLPFYSRPLKRRHRRKISAELSLTN